MSTKYIKAPYNFVPVNNKVVFPYWADLISHDIPFEDAHSGTLTVKLKAHSSVFVRNGAPKKPKEDQEKQHEPSFSQANGQYFIPGSSLKGMVRNVLEVMTFSKMGNKVDDTTFAYRDFHNTDLYNIIEITKGVQSGWLSKDKFGKYWVDKCGSPGRVRFDEIAKFFNKDFASFFNKDKDGFRFESDNAEHKSAKFKYTLFKEEGEQIGVVVTRAPAPPPEKTNRYDLREKYNIVSRGDDGEVFKDEDRKGIIVFTGQPSARIEPDDEKPSGKIYEFIFWEPIIPNKREQISEKVIEDMKCAYLDSKNKKEQSEDWKYWKQKLESEEKKIPVFFHEDNNSKITSIGLSFLYKYAYKYRVSELIGQDKKDLPDFSEALFGFIKGDKYEEGLKGRVHFGHAFAIADTTYPDAEASEVLSSPKASYYPNYIRQTNIKNGKVDRYNTFMDVSTQIAGWKRYPVHRNGVTHNPKPSSASEDVLVKFTPLKSGAEFEFKIRYHNLKKVELGALISALTFHITPNTFHSLGMAKPLGYGKVSLQVVNELVKQNDYLRAFEAYMTAEVNNWLACAQVMELLTMASDQQSDSSLAYMQLELRNNNEFTEAKKAKEALDVYSKLRGVQRKTANSLLHPGDIEKIQDEKTRFEKIKAKLVDKLTFLKTQEGYFQKALAQKKEELIQALRSRQAEIEKQVREEVKADLAESAKSGEPDWDHIDLAHRDAFENLIKAIKLFVQKLNQGIVYEKILKEQGNGLLPERLHEALINKVQQIFKNCSKSEKEQWKREPYEKNAKLKKVAEWIGEEVNKLNI